MDILTVSSESVFSKTSALLQKSLEQSLASEGKFLLFLSGGSAVNVYTQLIPFFKNSQHDFSSCAAVLVDERYDIDPNHTGSNARAIEESSFFDTLRNRKVQIETTVSRYHTHSGRYETAHGQSMEEDVRNYNSVVNRLLSKYIDIVHIQQNEITKPQNHKTTIFGVFGIGTDGHTAGIFPCSSLDKFQHIYETGDYVVGHELGQPPYTKRITITPQTIAKLDHVIVVAGGEQKKEALVRFKNSTQKDRHITPAVILKKVSQLTVITDQNVTK